MSGRSRRAGVLLGVASLPGPYGVGDLGPAARDFVRWLADGGQGVWQILPLSVVDGYGCPYASPSAFALEPLLLSLDDLVDAGWLRVHELPARTDPRALVDWSALHQARAPVLALAGDRIAASVDLDSFVERHPWVLPWAGFRALRERHGGPWTSWPSAARDLPLDGPHLAPGLEHPIVAREVALQWALRRQLDRLRALARAFDVQLWGDLPFFVAHDAADVWWHRDLFQLDELGQPTAITGVPPDAFAAEGQLWGHPQLDRAAHVAEGWRWWRARTQAALDTVDVLRIDHFRGIDAVWSVPAGSLTAIGGRWIDGPGEEPVRALLASGARLIAEDLGVITASVRSLRERLGLPGMAVLQFAFGPGGEPRFLPHAHERSQVVYTGTHDNDTLNGWLADADGETLRHLCAYLGVQATALPDAVRRAAWRSVADVAILPMQDVLGLGSAARLNTPGTLEANWSWRVAPQLLDDALASRLRREAILSGRR